ncbi:MAG: HAMP domain-containing histidine kinase [Clostridia bacterium]|nr:HAMP domain-containing histidine kinase [Clostridia bacterium]
MKKNKRHIRALSRIKDLKRIKGLSRIRLSFMIMLFVFCIILIAVLVAFGLVNLLAYTGIIISINETTSPVTLFGLMAAVSIIVGLAASFGASKIPIKPLYNLIVAIDRLASGDFKARMKVGKNLSSIPAVEQAVDSFNLMAEQLENTQMLRQDFINNFSHEFKTPIVSIAGFAKLLKKGNLTEEQRLEYLDIIEKESLRLSAMATNVLNLTKVENQTILTDISEYNLSEQLRNSILLLEPKWSDKNIDFDLKLGEQTISANKELLQEVWINLLDNAIKYTDGYIGILLSEDEDIKVEITNTGSTIPESKQTRIFDKFYQGDESHSSTGNGIGLALAKRIVELHGGEISLKSEDNTVTFTVLLPK